MEDNNNYTYNYEKENKKPERSLKTVFIIVIAALFVLSVLLGVLFGMKDSDEDETTTAPPETTTEEIQETTTSPQQLYKEGKYSVSTGGYSLRFREDHSQDAESIMDIPDGTELTVTEIYYDETAADDFKYWGQVTYLGHTGWVTMSFLEKEYSENIVTPEDITEAEATTDGETTTLAQSGTPSTETTTASSTVSTETTTSAASSAYSAGDYKIATGGYTLTFRESASATGTAIMNIADGTQITVVEVVDTGSSNADTRYWGKINYLGYTGYVAMSYLEKVN